MTHDEPDTVIMSSDFWTREIVVTARTGERYLISASGQTYEGRVNGQPAPVWQGIVTAHQLVEPTEHTNPHIAGDPYRWERGELIRERRYLTSRAEAERAFEDMAQEACAWLGVIVDRSAVREIQHTQMEYWGD